MKGVSLLRSQLCSKLHASHERESELGCVPSGTSVEKMEAIVFLCLRGHSSPHLSSVHFLLMTSVPELP